MSGSVARDSPRLPARHQPCRLVVAACHGTAVFLEREKAGEGRPIHLSLVHRAGFCCT